MASRDLPQPEWASCLEQSGELLARFAESSGLTGAEEPQRYLWTDAFAVMTWTGLYELAGATEHQALARQLIAQVHHVLAPEPRDPDHPTARGLRIGKPLAERTPDEPYNPELEWERDGQYYHYLTRWMRALERAAAVFGEPRYRQWAIELGQTAHRAFAHPKGAPQRLYWKMSIDLSRPLVPSTGAHDPLDGLVESASLGLERETHELAAMCDGHGWATDDPLGAGGLLLDALRLARLVQGGRLDLAGLLGRVIQDAALSAELAARTLRGPATERLAFRELGFALGLHALPLLEGLVPGSQRFPELAEALESFWLEPANQAAASWMEHRGINSVTLAASLAPQGVLG